MRKKCIIQLLVLIVCFSKLAKSQSKENWTINGFGTSATSGVIKRVHSVDDGMVLFGGLGNSQAGGVSLIKIDTSGAMQWSKFYEDIPLWQIYFFEPIDSGYYIGHTAEDGIFGLWHYEICRVDNYGNLVAGGCNHFPGNFTTSHEVSSVSANKINGDYITTNHYGHSSDLIRYDKFHNRLYKLNGRYHSSKDIMVKSATNYETIIVSDSSIRKIDSLGGNIWERMYLPMVGTNIIEHDSTVFLTYGGCNWAGLNNLIQQIDYYGNILQSKIIDSIGVIQVSKIDSLHLLIYGYKNNNLVLIKTEMNLNVVEAVQFSYNLSTPQSCNSWINSRTGSLFTFDSKNNWTTNFELMVYNSLPDTTCGKIPIAVSISNFPVQDSLINSSTAVQLISGTPPLTPVNIPSLLGLSQKYNGCVAVTVNEIPTKDIAVNIFPNPADHFINIALEEELTAPATVTITNLVGESVYEALLNKGQKQLKVDLSKLPAGLYFVQIKSVRGVGALKFQKE